MSKFRTAAFGAAVFLGMAASAAGQAPTEADSARGMKDGGVRRERVEGRRKMRMERGMRRGEMRKRAVEHRMRTHNQREMRSGDLARGMRAGHGMAQLNLTDAQRMQARAIHEKYQPQFRTLREQNRARSQVLQRQQQNEIRAVLTPEQRSKVDAAREAQARRMEEQAKALQERVRQLRTR